MLEGLDDADTAIDECFDGNIKISVGEIFVLSDETQAKQYVDKLRNKYTTENSLNTAKVAENNKRLDELKIILYSK